MHTSTPTPPERASTTTAAAPGPEVEALVEATLPAAREAIDRLLSAIAWADEPAGCRIIPDCPRGLWGLSRGSGHTPAIAAGYGGGVAVFVGVRMLIARWLDHHAEFDGIGRPEMAASWRAKLARTGATQAATTAVHELAHALVSARDEIPPSHADLERCRNVGAQAFAITAPDDAKVHPPAWAAAYAVLSSRAALVREADSELLEQFAKEDAAGYGIDLEVVRAAIGRVEPDAPIRPLLADAELIARVEATMLSFDDRVALRASKIESAAPGVPVAAVVGGSEAAIFKGEADVQRS
jgi:hypothetical protein